MAVSSNTSKPNFRRELVLHHRFDQAMEDAEGAISRAMNEDPQIVPIIGPTRVGKSTLLEQIAKSLNVGDLSDAGHKALTIRCQPVANPRALLDTCLNAVGLKPSFFKNSVAAMNAFTNAVGKHGYKTLIFDETQEILEKAKLTTRQIGDHFKQIHDSTAVSMVIAGLPTLMPLFNQNEQLQARALAPIKFYPYWHSGNGFEYFRSALFSVLEYMKEAGWETPDINDLDFVRRMYVATSGCYGLITKLFSQVETRSSKSRVADLQAFRHAYSKAMQNEEGKVNPFDPSRTIADVDMAKVYADALIQSGAALEVLEDDRPAV